MIIKVKILWLALLLLVTTLAACTAQGEEKSDLIEEQYTERVEEQEIIEEFEPTFLELEYMYSFEVDYFLLASQVEGEFTLFQTFGSGGAITFDDVNLSVQNTQRFALPENVNIDENSFITISMGRMLHMLYYFEEHRWDTSTGQVIARPVFEREYYPNTVFVYRVTPLPKYRFIYEGMFTDDFDQFNIFNNIPFEVWPYDRSLECGVSPSPGGRIRGSTLGEGWQELTEPLDGYIHVQETYLRGMPTEYSRVIIRLTYGDDFIINGYVEGGMDIDGNGRWYFVRTSMGSGNRIGYIHSSFVSITSARD